ncbi:MAG: penicillin-binding protein 2 [Chloroflexota bacterium]|nr:penicillin-binding protein 2 [Chloroflexota bacterium]
MAGRDDHPQVRIAIIAFALFLGFLVLMVQLVRWAVVQPSPLGRGSEPHEQALVAAGRGEQRGMIVDRFGEPLAFDTFRWEIWVEPRLVHDEEIEELADKLVETMGPALEMDRAELVTILAQQGAGTFTLTREAPEMVGEDITAWHRLDVGTRPIPTRYYPQGSMAAHVLGFVNGEPRAYYGVEEEYDSFLTSLETSFFRSDPGVQAAYSDLPDRWQRYLPSPVGQDLVLTIDRRMQYEVERTLGEAIGTYNAVSGTIIVMDPETGEIKAMASLPSYDPNHFGRATNTVLANPAITSQYEPGSIFKIITIASGIDAGIITPDSVLTDIQKLEVGGRTIMNSDRMSHGEVSIWTVLSKSLNVPTAKVALELGESRFYQYVRRFGFGQLTEVDLANEIAGTVKVPGDTLWSESDLATNAFGQGLAATPLQMATAAAAIANDGVLVQPHIVDSMVFQGRVMRPSEGSEQRVIKADSAKAMIDLMVNVVEEGVPLAAVPGYTVAGKTGTAQVAIEGGYHPTATVHSFVGFAPAYDPEFVVLVKLDRPTTNPWSMQTAAPTFSRVVKKLLHMAHVPPEQVANKP